MTHITGFDTYDIRFPASRTPAGSDAMNPAPGYSAAALVLRTTHRTGWPATRTRSGSPG